MALDRSSLLPTFPWPIPRRVLCASRPQALRTLSLLTDGGLAAQMAGFTSWPKPNLVKEPYPTVAERLHAGKAAYRAWLKTPDGAGCTYVLPDTSDEEEDDEVEQIMEERIVVRRPLLPSCPPSLAGSSVLFAIPVRPVVDSVKLNRVESRRGEESLLPLHVRI